MKRAAIAVWVVFLLSPLAAAPQTAPAGAGIAGIVIAAGTDRPVAGALLTLTQLDAPAPSVRPPSGPDELWGITATSGADGRFEFSGLAPGAYKLTVTGNGYVRQEVVREAAPIVLAEGQVLADVGIRLTPTGTITGVVRDASGRPLPGIPVQAIRRTYTAVGDPAFQIAAQTTTNDRGEYRLYWLTPGRYYVAAAYGWSLFESEVEDFDFAFASGSNTVWQTYPQMFFPGSIGPEQAVLLDVQPASELGGIDVALATSRRYRIRGSVIDAQTGMPPAQATVRLDRFAVGADAGGSSPMFYDPGSATFDIPGLLPGTYGLSIVDGIGLITRMAGSMQRRRASAKVTVTDSDVEALVLFLDLPTPVAGRIRFENETTPPPAGLRVRLRPANIWDPPVAGVSSLISAPSTPEGAFVLDELPAGDFRITIQNLPAGLYVKEARLDNADVLSSAAPFSRGGTLEIVLSSSGGQVEGVVMDSGGRPAPALAAVLVPDAERHRSELFKTATTDAAGRFDITGIAPGDYKLFAWENLEPYAYFDPEFLRQFEDRGLPLRVPESSSQTVRVPAIPEGDLR